MKSEKEHEVDQTRSKAMEKIKVQPSSKSSFFSELEVKKMEQNNVINVSDFDTQDDDELSEELARGDSLHNKNTRRRADTQELLAKGPNSQRKASAAAKPTYRTMESEEENEVDQSEYMVLERMKVHLSRKSSFFSEGKKM